MSENLIIWYVMVESNRKGPLAIDNIFDLIRESKIRPDSMVWREGLNQWTPANQLPEFASLANPKLPPPPPPQPSTPPTLPGSSNLVASESHIDLKSFSLTTSPSSSLAQAISQAVGDNAWKALIGAGLNPNTVVACIPISQLKFQEETNESTDSDAFSLLRRVSSKISEISNRRKVDGENYLIDGGSDQVFIASKLTENSEVFSLPRKALYISNRWKDDTLEMEVQISDSNSKIKSLVCRFAAGEPIPNGLLGNFVPLLLGAAVGVPQVSPDVLKTFFLTRLSVGQRNSFKAVFSATGSISLVDLEASGIHIWHSGKSEKILLGDILAWQASENAVDILAYSSNHVRRWQIALPGQLDSEERTEIQTELSDSQAPFSEGSGTNGNLDHSDNELESLTGSEISAEPVGVNSFQSGIDLGRITNFLKTNLENFRANYEMLAAELDCTCVFTKKSNQVLIKLRDSECLVAIKDRSVEDLSWFSNARLYAFADRQFLQVSPEFTYQIHISESEQRLAGALAMVTEETASLDRSLVLLSQPNDQISNDGESLPWDDFQPFLIKIEDGAIRFVNVNAELQESTILETHLEQVGSRSHLWKDTFGVISIKIDGEEGARLLIGGNRTLIQLWEQAELKSLTVRTTGVPLGKLYHEYNKSRCEKYITGVFGEFFVTQQRLDQASKLDSLMLEISAAPAGPLSGELNDKLIQRLSILEVSRHQLGRWLDRFALMYPHYMAQREREWLANVFGERIVDRTTQDRETWRVHQQLRSELRQVQASMGKTLAEIGQNLNAISWAFPEEVRFAALANIRRAAGFAEKGAMLAAFGGIGGQLLVGLGRASVGDPLGVGMVGALGLSLVGKHLDKNVKEKEKLIRLRAYGMQAFQWWYTTLETASVMALELRQSMELSRQAAMLRDRQVLEKLSADQLSLVQQRMAAVMRQNLHEDVSSEFYEAVPGSGLFGWHLVDQISETASIRSMDAFNKFRGELPGTMANCNRQITIPAVSPP